MQRSAASADSEHQLAPVVLAPVRLLAAPVEMPLGGSEIDAGRVQYRIPSRMNGTAFGIHAKQLPTGHSHPLDAGHGFGERLQVPLGENDVGIQDEDVVEPALAKVEIVTVAETPVLAGTVQPGPVVQCHPAAVVSGGVVVDADLHRNVLLPHRAQAGVQMRLAVVGDDADQDGRNRHYAGTISRSRLRSPHFTAVSTPHGPRRVNGYSAGPIRGS